MRTFNGRETLRPRPQLFHIAVLTAALTVLSGCAAFRGFGGSPGPNGTPGTNATPSPTHAQAPIDTPRPSTEQIGHPTGKNDVILRVEWGGGLVPMQYFVTQAPQFTLYGDGTAVFRPLPNTNGAAFDEPEPPFLTGHMSEDAVQELLHYALHDAGLATAKNSYDYPNIADAGTTMFWIKTDDVDKSVGVYALFEGANDGPDAADRTRLIALEQRLRNFETEARAGAVDEVTDYDPDYYKVVMFDEAIGTPASGVTPIEWPWRDIKPSDFEANDESIGATLYMTRDQVAKLTDVPNGGQMSVWVKSPSGSVVSFAVRPMLPGDAVSAEQID